MLLTNTRYRTGLLIALVIVVALAGGVWAVLRSDIFGRKGSGLGNEWTYDISNLRKTDPNLVHYVQAASFKAGFEYPRALAVDPKGMLYIGGDNEVRAVDGDGNVTRTIRLADSPRALACAAEGSLFVATKEHVEIYDAAGALETRWGSLGEKAQITSIAVANEDVFVGDAGNRVVVHYDRSGKVLGQIGRRDKDRGIPGLILPSPHLDVAVDGQGLLRVSNPGMWRIETYTFKGDLELFWGSSSMTDIAGFCGCCNPTDFAILPDGRFVTSEKGLVRVKVYSADGKFDCVVAGPETFDKDAEGLDLAVDAKGRIYVLDGAAKTVRVFAPKGRK